MKENHTKLMSQLKKELETERLKNQIVGANESLSFGKAIGEEQRFQMDEMKVDLDIANERVKRYEHEITAMKRDIDSACVALEEAKNEKEKAVQEVIVNEAKVAEQLRQQEEAFNLKEDAVYVKCSDMEKQLTQLRDQLHICEERNSWYEDGFGISDAVRYQKKLEADIRRREFDRKRLLVDLGKKDDQIVLLVKTFQRFKNNTGDTMQFDEEELKAASGIEESGLHGQNRELIKQVQSLEEERISLLKRLRDNSAILGEDSVRFLGLSSQDMEKVTQFAMNLKEGKIQLPMDDRSMELSAKLSRLNATRQSDLLTI